MKIARLYEIFKQYPQVTTDSRRVVEGSIFFALRGDNFDGNRFAAQAIADGAVMAVVDDASMCPDGANYFVVEDVLTTLQELARMHRRALGLPVVAVTGTNGKTTTKELLAAILARKYRVAATRGNLNNHIGVPLTLLSLSSADEVAVVEMGASSVGEIAALCAIAEPDYGIITNIGRAHLGGFGGEAGVRRAKGELYDWLTEHGGRAFVNSTDSVLTTMAEERTTLEWSGYSPATVEGWKSNLAGEYNLYNIAAAAAVGAHFGVEQEQMRSAVAEYQPTIHRSQVIRTERNVVIADCYNANPSSMEAALDNFAKMPLPEGVTRKVALLGDMLELGEWSREEHAKALVAARQAVGAGELLLVGENFAKVAPTERTPSRTVRTFADRAELEKYLTRKPIESALVLVKGSHSVGLGMVIPML